MRSWLALGLFGSLAAVALLIWETRRLAEVSGRLEIEARDARAAAAVATAAAAASVPAHAEPAPVLPPSPQDQDPVSYAQMALELRTTQDQLAAVTALLEQRNEQSSERVRTAAAAAERNNLPMAEGVRNCLIALHDCLRAEGYFGPRFLRAEVVGPDGLEKVEMLDADSAGVDVAVVTAGKMTATLDRSRGRFELRFFDGERAVRGQHLALPKDGWALTFEDVDGRMFESRLPYLLRLEGAYPEPSAREAKPATDLDPILRRQWLERLDRVLAKAGMQPGWRITRFRGLDNGWFLVGEMVSTDDKHRVVAGAHCARFAIEVDPVSNVASLLLRDGVLRRGAVESSITGEGYRMLLPNLDCKQATDAMIGMVVTR